MLSPTPRRKWIRATTAGWGLGILLIIGLVLLFSGIGGGELQVPLGLGMGLGVGHVQGRALTADPRTRRRWTIATAVGLTVPFVLLDVGQAIGLRVPFVLGGMIAIGGVACAVLQLRAIPDVAGVSGWVAASALGWSLAGATVALNDQLLARLIPGLRGIGGALLYLTLMFVGGPLLGAAQAIALRPRRSAAPGIT